MSTTTVGLTDAERELRRLGIGGSDVPAIVGLAANRGPLTVWREKVEGYSQPSTEQMEFGHRWEQVANRWFEDRTGFCVVGVQRSVTHPEAPWARATLDGLVAEPLPVCPRCTGTTGRSIEVRSRCSTCSTWCVRYPLGPVEHKSFNVVEDGDVKPDVLAQALWQLHVTGLPTAWVTGLVGHAFVIRQVHAADHLDDTAWLVEQAARFWHDHVLTERPPKPTVADLPMLEGIPATPGAVLEVGTDIAAMWAERQALKAEITGREKRVKELDAELRDLIGEAETITYAGVPIIAARETTRTGLDTDAVRAAFPEIAACRSLTTATTFRTLRDAPKPKTRRPR